MSSSDTIHGEIDYRSRTRNYQSCLFKKDGTEKEFAPSDLIGYHYKDDKYYSADVIAGSFVEVLVAGELSLYLFETYLYARKTGGELFKLEPLRQTTIVEGKAVLQQDYKWKGMLGFLTRDCYPGLDAFVNMRPSEKNIKNMVVDYNTCRGSAFKVYNENKPRTQITFAGSVGLIRSTITTKSAYNLAYLSDHYQTLAPSIGLVMSISSPRVSEKFSFQPEIHLGKASYSAMVVESTPTESSYYTSIKLTTLSIPLALRYSLLERNYGVYILAGVNYDFQIQSDTRVRKETTFNNFTSTSENPYFNTGRSQVGFGGGLMVARPIGTLNTSLILNYFFLSNMSLSSAVKAYPDKLSLSIQISKK